MRLIDAEALKKVLCEEYEAREHYIGEIMLKAIDNAPTIIWCNKTPDGLPLMDLRSQGICKDCDRYNPYCEQFTNEPRGDGYCTIARMTSEGMTYINCTDEWSCADFCPKGEEK